MLTVPVQRSTLGPRKAPKRLTSILGDNMLVQGSFTDAVMRMERGEF